MLDIEHKYQTYKSLNQQLLRPCIDELNKNRCSCRVNL
ncbi:hypothetical protein ACSLNA_25935 [Escherichia coli]